MHFMKDLVLFDPCHPVILFMGGGALKLHIYSEFSGRPLGMLATQPWASTVSSLNRFCE